MFNLLLLHSDIFNFSSFKTRKVITAADYSSCPSSVISLANTLESSTWNCAAIFEFTASVIETDSFEYAKPIFELASRQCAELLCIALAAIDPPWQSINKEILVKLTCGFVLGQTSSALVLPRIWALNPNVLLFCMVEMYRRDNSCLSRLLDVTQDLKILQAILDAKPFSFALELACLASRRQILNLDKWLSESLVQKGDFFIREVVAFVYQKAGALKDKSMSNHSVSPEALSIMFNQLAKVFHLMQKDVVDKFREAHNLFLSNFNSDERAAHANLASGAEGLFGEITFATDVEEEVNNFFDRIFVREIGIPDTIQILRQLKESKSVRDQQVFSCFLHNLFDEYRFFGKYPDSELSLTAILFGQLINCDILSATSLQVALRCVQEALRKPIAQKLFKFGLQALAQFHTRLPEWPQFCSQLLQISHIQQQYHDLYEFIKHAQAGDVQIPIQSTHSISSSNNVPSYNTVAGNSRLATSTQTDLEENLVTDSNDSQANPLLEAAELQRLPMPNEAIRDRILFILNNLSNSNIEIKANDLVKILEETHFAWLAQYLVVRRASIEPNYHRLYLDFIEVLQVRALEQHILRQTYVNIYHLLDSSHISDSSSERTLLKNLGSWLGGLTLARNIPILYRDICLKELLIDAFVNNRLIYIIPFVCKVIEQASRSIAFQPENPWLMAIMRLMAELYSFADLKLNLKFEIEVVCKNLAVDLQSLVPSGLLKSSIEQKSLANALHLVAAKTGTCSAFVTIGNSVPHNLRVSSTMTKIVSFAVEYAVRDLAPSTVQRALQHAMNATKVLANKDQVFERSAVKLASSVAATSASALLRETLSSTIAQNIRLYLEWARIPLAPEQIEALTQENLDLASALVGKIALSLSHSFFEKSFGSIRDGHKQQPSSMVEKARKIYEEFGQIPNLALFEGLPVLPLNPVSEEELNRLASILAAESRSISATFPLPDTPATSASLVLSTNQTSGFAPSELFSPGLPAVDSSLDAFFESVCIKFVDMVTSIEKIVSSLNDSDIDSVSKLPPSHELRSMMKQIILLASSSPIHRDELCLLMSQRLMQGLYRTESPLYVDVIILLLIKIFEFSSKAAKEVTSWVVHSCDERKYCVLATVALFGSGLIYVLDFDGQLAKQIESGRSTSVVPFAISLIRRCIFSDKPVAAPYDFVFTLEVLGKIANGESEYHLEGEDELALSIKKEISQLLRDIAIMVKSPQPEAQLIRDQITFCFTDWFRLCQYPSISDKLVASFVAQLFQRSFMDDEESARTFFQICTELSIELYVRQRRAPAILAYRSIDAFARLVGQIIHLHPHQDISLEHTPLEPLRIITIAHSVAGMVFVQGHEQGIHYLQRPLSRLFTSLSSECLIASTSFIDKISLMENLR